MHVLVLFLELLPTESCQQCDQLQSPHSECESMMTDYENEQRYPQNHPFPQFFAPPPPDHPPSDMEGDHSPGATARNQRTIASAPSDGRSVAGASSCRTAADDSSRIVHSRRFECYSRHVVSSSHRPQDGVAVEHEDVCVGKPTVPLGSSFCRLICASLQFTASSLSVSVPGHSCSGGGCPPVSVASGGLLRFPSSYAVATSVR